MTVFFWFSSFKIFYVFVILGSDGLRLREDYVLRRMNSQLLSRILVEVLSRPLFSWEYFLSYVFDNDNYIASLIYF